jgi:hypothetical protein
MNTTDLVLALLVGTIPGFYVGRWWSELGRGQHDARRAWDGRRKYRDTED